VIVKRVINALAEPPHAWSDGSDDYKRVCERMSKRDGSVDESDLRTRRLRFIHALTLARRSRHPAATLSWAFIKAIEKGVFVTPGVSEVDNDEQRFYLSQAWLGKLLELNVGRSQPGGCFWMHNDVRRNLRTSLEEKNPFLKNEQATCHQGLADWYLKLFRASNDPSAALESIYHRISCSTALGSAEESNSGKNLKLTSMVAAVETLTMARPEIIARGHVRASVHLLTSLKERCDAEARFSMSDPNAPSMDICRELTWQCWKLHRDYEHEIADFGAEFDMNGQEPPHCNPRGASTAEEEYKKAYRRAVTQMGLRNYGAAWTVLTDLLSESLGIKLNLDGILHWENWPPCDANAAVKSSKIIEGMRNLGNDWGSRSFNKQGELKLGVQALRRLMFLVMLRAQVLNPDKGPDVNLAFVCAEGLYVLATSIMRFVVDHDWIQTENVYLRTNLSVALAKLGRFTEATRRLYEASGYLASSSKSKSPLTWAVIDLRRAEVYLERAERLRRGDIVRLALLDRAESSLSRAEHRLQDHPANVWWRTFYYELCLRLLACRAASRDGNGRALRGGPEILYKRGRDLIWNDVYRLTRLLKFYDQISGAPEINAVADLQKVFENRRKLGPTRENITKIIESTNDLDKHVMKFIKRIIKKIERGKGHITGIGAPDELRDMPLKPSTAVAADARPVE